MSLTTAFAIYFLIWWIALFAILPFGVRRQEESERAPGSDPGAPGRPRILAKLAWTTLIASLIFALFYLNDRAGFITLDDLIRWFGWA